MRVTPNPYAPREVTPKMHDWHVQELAPLHRGRAPRYAWTCRCGMRLTLAEGVMPPLVGCLRADVPHVCSFEPFDVRELTVNGQHVEVADERCSGCANRRTRARPKGSDRTAWRTVARR